ncbi:type III effector protein [Streptomyces rochei]|uniref:type III effector protein n=1 Tax=Streptomyces rochei TaxID=1928 RepID=UPI0036A66E36
MTADPREPASGPVSFLAAEAALAAIERAVHTAQDQQSAPRDGSDVSPDQALAALLLLREVRDQLAGWETGLIETAREAGASWAELAHPLGVASRQAAERRYLRLRPGAPGTTGEQRVQATRDRRAGDRAVTTWARGNAAGLRQLAGQITAVDGLPAEARAPLVQALGQDDAAGLIAPLAGARDHLAADHGELAARIDDLTHHTDRLRRVRPAEE